MDIPALKSCPATDDNRRQLADFGIEHNALELNIYGFTVIDPERTGYPGGIAALADAAMKNTALQTSESLIQAAVNPVALTLVRFLIGPDIHLFGVAPAISPQKELEEVPLHSDVNLPTPLPEAAVTVTACWILDDVDGLYVIPGSHRFGHNPGTAGAADPNLPQVTLSATAGSLAVWHGHLWHGVKRGPGPRKLKILPLIYSRPYLQPLQQWLTSEGDNQEWAAKYPELEALIKDVDFLGGNRKGK